MIWPYKLKVKGESVYKGLMTLIRQSGRERFCFATLGFVKHVFPRKQGFMNIVIYTMDCIHLKKKKKIKMV
jgi:hypothetical protein